MPIPFTCPHCQTYTVVADQFAGHTGPCGRCSKTITIPWPQAGAAPQSPSFAPSRPGFPPPRPTFAPPPGAAAESEGNGWGKVLLILLSLFVVGILGFCGLLMVIGYTVEKAERAERAEAVARRQAEVDRQVQFGQQPMGQPPQIARPWRPEPHLDPIPAGAQPPTSMPARPPATPQPSPSAALPPGLGSTPGQTPGSVLSNRHFVANIEITGAEGVHVDARFDMQGQDRTLVTPGVLRRSVPCSLFLTQIPERPNQRIIAMVSVENELNEPMSDLKLEFRADLLQHIVDHGGFVQLYWVRDHASRELVLLYQTKTPLPGHPGEHVTLSTAHSAVRARGTRHYSVLFMRGS